MKSINELKVTAAATAQATRTYVTEMSAGE
jgi:hypothetical protein